MLGFGTWERRGLAATVWSIGHMVVVAGGLHDQAADRAAEADVVVIDMAMPHRWDRWEGIEVVRRLRSRPAAGRPAVVVVSGRADDVHLRQRCAEAGVDALWPSTAIASEDDLAAIVSEPLRSPLVPPSATELRQVSLRLGCSLNGALDVVRGTEVALAMAARTPLAETGLGRRRALAVRRSISARARLETSLERLTGGPMRDVSVPTWRETCRLVDRARGLAPDEAQGAGSGW